MGANGPNMIAVVVAALAHWLLGAGWFTLFKKQWHEGIGKTPEQLAAAGMPVWLPHVVTLVANLAMAYVLGWLIVATGPRTTMRGVQVAAMAWAGLVASSFATEYVFEAKSIQIFSINAGYPLVGMLIMGGILGTWQR